MTKILSVIALLGLMSSAFADHGNHPRRGRRAVAVVAGKKAQAIYEALQVEEVTKSRRNFSLEIKNVAPLRCVKATKKADTAVVKYRCALKGQKKRTRRGQRRGHRRGRGGNGHTHGA